MCVRLYACVRVCDSTAIRWLDTKQIQNMFCFGLSMVTWLNLMNLFIYLTVQQIIKQ